VSKGLLTKQITFLK